MADLRSGGPKSIVPWGELNTRGVTEYSDFRPIERSIAEMVQHKSYICINHWHISFRLVPNSVTLDDLERRNSLYRRVISPNSILSGRITYKWLKIRRYFLLRKCRPQNLVFSDISFMVILAWVTPSKSDKMRHSALASENLTNNQP